MAPRFEKFTVKARESVQSAQSIADQREHQALEPEHLLLALLEQQEGIVGPLLAKLGVPVDGLRRELETQFGKLPTVRGASGSYPRSIRRSASPRSRVRPSRSRSWVW